ncbi:hypothetical protein M3Y97_00910500 [Aphelenchoides bicaudatus]|nr:hypothetical protein M3Y97_00910500 [Aphelenchoides bicaudatus]
MLRISYTLFLFLIVAEVECRSQYVRCFQRFERKSIDNYQPIAEFFYVSPHQCIDQCITATNNAIKIGLCKSFVYNHLQHSCRLYDHSGNQIPAIIHPAIGYDLYRRTATTQECGGPLQRFFAQTFKHKESDDFAKAAHEPIHQIQNPIQFGDTAELSPALPSPIRDVDIEEAGAPSIRPETFHKDEITTHQTEENSETTKQPTRKYGVNFRVIPRQKASTKTPLLTEAPFVRNGLKLPSTLKPAVEYTRPCSTTTGFYVADGNEMLIPQDLINQATTIKDTTRQKCLDYCAENTNQQSEPFKCLTLNFNNETNTCTLYSVLAQPHGQGKLVDNAQINYAEKFCVPQHKGQCVPNAIFDLKADHLIAHNVIASTSSAYLVECLKSCLNTDGCKCSSFDSKTKQCLLHDVCSSDDQKSVQGWVLIKNGCHKLVSRVSKVQPVIVRQTKNGASGRSVNSN